MRNLAIKSPVIAAIRRFHLHLLQTLFGAGAETLAAGGDGGGGDLTWAGVT